MNLFDTLVTSTPATSPGGAPRVILVQPDHLIADETNTRELRDVEVLAQGIFAFGLDNPLTVRPDPDRPAGYYKIIAGHRRLAACNLCIEWGDPHGFASAGIPCINKGEQGEAAAHLRLILNNRLHRDPTGYEEMIETAQLAEMDPEALRAELERSRPGGAAPAKTRDVIAALLNMSASKAAKYLAIYRHLPPERMEDYKAGHITTEAAYTMVSESLKQSRKPKPPVPDPAPVFGPNTTQSTPAVPKVAPAVPTPQEAPRDPVPAGGEREARPTATEQRPTPQQTMDRLRTLIQQNAPAEWQKDMLALLADMWGAYREE